ncbi:MAG: bacillithiol system redox-active protein YtxJ [Bacteroidetes bacterium SW_11_45_7]|nr:MAG: bacillithiol system redox-active protein YtxJ [Bacteroidetes bacterium SW_11_45_7]
MEWYQLTDEAQLANILELSKQQPVLIYKHSTRCSLSMMIKEHLEEEWDVNSETVLVYYLDIIANKPLSNRVAYDFHVPHQSPQILLIQNGECTYHTSHLAIKADKIKQQAAI